MGTPPALSCPPPKDIDFQDEPSAIKSPWSAGHKKVMSAWEEIAKNCAKQHGFGLKAKKGPALKTRFSLLMEAFKKDEMASLRKSGATEEFEEREILLTDIKNRMDDYCEVEILRKDKEKKKKEGIETSGLLLRQMAMEEQFDIAPRKRKRSSLAKSNAMEGILALIKESIAAKRERDELLLAQQRERDELLLAERRERLEFDKAEAKANAERFAANQ
ncbi:hypothetical protein AC1031_014899 [Aphanomyces cochlioides]|nr:hypothetical protein AC1031_014899 [Aphanomyces cochlioides]